MSAARSGRTSSFQPYPDNTAAACAGAIGPGSAGGG